MADINVENINKLLDRGVSEKDIVDGLVRADPSLASRVEAVRAGRGTDAQIITSLTGGRVAPRTKAQPAAPAAPAAPPRTVQLESPEMGYGEAILSGIGETPLRQAGSFLGRLLPATAAAVTPGGPGFKETYAARRRAQEEAAAAAPPEPQIKSVGPRIVKEVTQDLGVLASLYGGGMAAAPFKGVTGATGRFLTATPMADLFSTVLGAGVTGVTNEPLAGMAAGMAGGVSGPALRHLYDAFLRGDIKKTAEAERLFRRDIYNAMLAEGENPEMVAKRLEELGPKASLMDASPAIRKWAEGLIGRPAGKMAGPTGMSAQHRINEFLQNRLRPEIEKGELQALIDPTAKATKAATTRETARVGGETAAKEVEKVTTDIASLAKQRLEGRAGLRPQLIQAEIGTVLKPRENVEKNLTTYSEIRKDLNEQARQFLKDPAPPGVRAELDDVLKRYPQAKEFYESIVNELRRVDDARYAALLPVDPTEARSIVKKFEDATKNMKTDAERKKFAETFLTEDQKRRYGSLEGVVDEASGTKNVSVDIVDRVSRWARDKGYAQMTGDAATKAREQIEGEIKSVVREKLNRVLRENVGEYDKWKTAYSTIKFKESGVDLGRQAAEGKISPNQIQEELGKITNEEQRKAFLEAAQDGFVDSYSRLFQRGDPSKMAEKLAPVEETRLAMQALFGEQKAKQMSNFLEQQAGQIGFEKSMTGEATAATKVERGRERASEFGAEYLYQRLADAEKRGGEQKALLEAVDQGRKAMGESMTVGDMQAYMARLTPKQQEAFLQGFMEDFTKDPRAYYKAALEKKGQTYEKMLKTLGPEVTQKFEEIARQNLKLKETSTRFFNAIERKPPVSDETLVDKGINATKLGIQANVGFLGNVVDTVKKGFKPLVGAEFPNVRQVGASQLTMSPAEQAAYVRDLLANPPSGVWSEIARRVLPPVTKAPVAVGVGSAVGSKPVRNENLLAEELKRGERPL